MMLNVYLTWQLLLKVIGLLRRLSFTLHFCGWCRVEGVADGAHWVRKVLDTHSRHHIRCEGGLDIRWGRGVGQGGAGSGSCRKCND